ncbi:MAG: hypothetical protein GWP08_13185 [Nitrospiraceae bacterium]|nr:hypothetical protein [Nitrospiraceae bacterium]
MERNWPQLHHDVVFGRAGGKIIWQPRIGCWYTDKQFDGTPLPAPYTGMSVLEVYRALDCSARLYDFNTCFRRIPHPDERHEERPLGGNRFEQTITTPAGVQKAIYRATPTSACRVNEKWEVSDPEELRVAAWRERHTTWAWDQERFDATQAAWGDLGAPTMFMPRMNVQSLYLEKMGIQEGIMAIYEYPEAVEEYFEALEVCHDRLIDIINACPIDIINFGENVHSSTLPPDLFERYHLPACQRRCERLHEAGKFVHSHWDGDCGPLLRYAQETGLDGIEAITPQPQGDVTLDQVKDALGDTMFLVDGLPAVYFDDTYDEQVLIDCTHRLIDLFAPRLVLGISDEISSTGDIERVRTVGEIVDRYNASCESAGDA